VRGYGDKGFDPEDLYAYEVGYRVNPTSTLSFDLAAYYNYYPNLESIEQGEAFLEVDPPPLHLVSPQVWSNRAHADVQGIEALVEWRPYKWWRLQGWYSHVNIDQGFDPGSIDNFRRNDEGNSAQNQAHLRSLVDLPWNMELDSSVRYVDGLGAKQIPGYVEMGVRLGWKIGNELELSLMGQNLLEERHREYDDFFVASPRAAIERSVYAKITWRPDAK
jgi:iron complex outermembrane recepter protein